MPGSQASGVSMQSSVAGAGDEMRPGLAQRVILHASVQDCCVQELKSLPLAFMTCHAVADSMKGEENESGKTKEAGGAEGTSDSSELS